MIAQLRNASPRREAVFMAVAAVILIALPWIMPYIGGYRELATRILIWGIFALGFDILVGFTGYLSFGHAAFWGIGAYCSGYYLLHANANALVAILIGVAVATAVAILLGYLTLRRHGIYFAILTLAFAEMFYYAALAPLQDWTGGDNGLTGIRTPELFGVKLDGDEMHYFVAAWTLLAIYFARRIARSPFGLMLRAIKSNETRLQSTGVNVYRYKVTAFAISGLYAGLAGTLYALYETYVPTESLHWTTSGEVVIMSVIGGFGTLIGPMIGAGIVLYLENVLSASTEQWLLIQGLIFMFFVIFLPGGVMEGLQRLADWGRKRHESATEAEARGAAPKGASAPTAPLRQRSQKG
ncbi:branched-chain amino acid ABC transporter permease [Rhodospirillaceae bacterium SYSU D60014]|uniref:branched-chain amino acid ABC transporter permease n=1 Tax=Virgifigura deserti TaxID=2268457 RepID=UPI0013C5122C